MNIYFKYIHFKLSLSNFITNSFLFLFFGTDFYSLLLKNFFSDFSLSLAIMTY